MPGAIGGDATWDFAFSVNTHAGATTGDTLSTYTYLLTITDLTTSVTNSFSPTLIPDNAPVGTAACHGCTYNGANFGMQNAENLSFTGVFPGFNPNAPDTYQITLAANSATNSSSVQINVLVAAPEPGTWLMPAAGIPIAAFFRRRKRTR